MRKKQKLAYEDNYWSQVLIAFAQVTFGVAWGSLFLSLDTPRIIIVIANLGISVILVLLGGLIRKR